MRAIPPELLTRIKKRAQVPAENADPSLKILLSRGLVREMFQVFTVHNGSQLTDIDVTVRRLETTQIPAYAYAIYVQDGVAHIKSKPLPYDDQTPWDYEFQVGNASAVAIEFDGYWDRDHSTRRFNFVTEDLPWVFYVQSGSLKAQLWQGTVLNLATNVTKVAAIRGWLPVEGDHASDQGLIVAYLKADGTMWYRAYCRQDVGGRTWEVERQVTAFPEGFIDDLALFRSNDFRIGFIAEIAGQCYWALTTRNFAGMSVWPERITARVVDFDMVVHQIQYPEHDSPDEHLSATVADLGCWCCPADTAVAVVSVERIASDTLEIEFDAPIAVLNETWLLEYATVKDTTDTPVAIQSITQTDDYTIQVKCATSIPSATVFFAMDYPGARWLTFYISPTCQWPLDVFSIEAEGEPPNHATHITIDFDLSIAAHQISFPSLTALPTHHITGRVFGLSMTVTRVGEHVL